jgi:hypothetical protein
VTLCDDGCLPYVSVLSLHFQTSEMNLSNMSDGEDHRMQGGDFMGQTIDEDVEMEMSRDERSKKVGSDDRGRDAEAGNEEGEDDDDDDEEEEGPNERKRKRAKVGVNFHLSN